jgi:hypothetical protein
MTMKNIVLVVLVSLLWSYVFPAVDGGVPIQPDLLKNPNAATLSISMSLGSERPMVVFMVTNLSTDKSLTLDAPEVFPSAFMITTPTGKIVKHEGAIMEGRYSPVIIQPGKIGTWRYSVGEVFNSIKRFARHGIVNDPTSEKDYQSGIYIFQWVIEGCKSNQLSIYLEKPLMDVTLDE